MPRLALLISITTFGVLFTMAASVQAATESQLAQLEQRVAKAATSTAGEYAQNFLDDAKTSIAEAKINIAAGKEKIAARHIERADILLIAADAKGAEKELLEKVAVRRSELKKMEARLERFRQGEEN
jgi:uncharacterized cupredoxin-like copper-binding protein